MRAEEERVLEHALRCAFGARDAVDVTAAVVARIRARNGVNGVAPPPAPVHALPSARDARPRARRVLVAAAALVALAVLGWLAWPVRDAVVATATRPVSIARAGGAGPTEVDALVRAGDVVAIGVGPDVELRMRGGAVLRSQPRTVLAVLSATRCRLRTGAVTVASAADPVVLETSPATLRIAQGSVLEARAAANSYPTFAPELFEENARAMIPGSMLFPVTLSVTLVAGAASITTADATRELQVGATVVVEDPAPPASTSSDELAREVGPWVLELVEIDPETGARERFRGRESCEFGPGKHWIQTHIGIAKPNGTVELAMILGFDAKRGVWHGSLVDSFGGQMALLEGTGAPDGDERVLEMRRFDGQPLEARMRTRWNGTEERRTVFETRRDGEWRVVREVLHRRPSTSRDAAAEREMFDVAKRRVQEIHEAVATFMEDNDGRIPTWRDLLARDARGRQYLEARRPELDPWGNLYVIGRHPERDGEARVMSWGPDGQEGTADDIDSGGERRAVQKRR